MIEDQKWGETEEWGRENNLGESRSRIRGSEERNRTERQAMLLPAESYTYLPFGKGRQTIGDIQMGIRT